MDAYLPHIRRLEVFHVFGHTVAHVGQPILGRCERECLIIDLSHAKEIDMSEPSVCGSGMRYLHVAKSVGHAQFSAAAVAELQEACTLLYVQERNK